MSTLPKKSGSPVLRPECVVAEHSWCKLDEVRVGGALIFPAPRCDCSCHKRKDRP